MDEDHDTCRVCGDTLHGIERKRGTCKDCSDGKVRK